MSHEIVVTRTNWFHVVQNLNPEQPVVVNGPRQHPVFVLSGNDGTIYKVQRKELQTLMLHGKLPIWLMAMLVESGLVEE